MNHRMESGMANTLKDEKMNVEALSRAELLTLLSVLEGELEAQDVVIHALRAQQRDTFVQERYGEYDLSDPFLALQRDSEPSERQNTLTQTRTNLQGRAVGPNPLAVLKLVMAHCKRMQERMMGQLSAAESRHRRIIADLEEEKRRCAQKSAQNDDFTFMLQAENDKLLLQLEVERATVRRLEKEHAQAVGQVEESLSQQQELSSNLTLELQKACSQAQEEAHKVSQLRTLLREETSALEKLTGVLGDEKSRAAQLDVRSERQLAEFDIEREQMKARIGKEEERSKGLERQLEELRKRLAETGGVKEELKESVTEGKESLSIVGSTSVQTEPDGKITAAPKSSSLSKVNGHPTHKESEPPPEGRGPEHGGVVENGGAGLLHSPLPPHPHLHSPSSTASSSLSSSPISSPVLAKRLGSPGFHQSSYQAGINQRFHAARHKFQSQAELEQQQHGGPLSPRDLSPTTSSIPPPLEHSSAKQLARNTVTQVLSRFTSQQAGVKLAPLSSSPFGTDYRNLAATPPGGRSPSSGPLSPGIRSPLTPRSERTHPPLTAPKKPGMSPTPGSPSHSARTSLFPELTGNCGQRSSGQEGAKEPDLVLSSSS
ncbi:CTTNBP2 N-terminal-like protein isoform X2 [Pseudoliparis swirei]|uniref:CTTNBP2 N-terminal-like protein isoform X2 n=1 Tax=Pseudoliparis swirei TaxID=2059687 RepID=UPI0024BDE47A|nr:CTTNBP2 N-terminal-like protein isoform X2 [Pseudoliparis swirei]XP_056279451.1 CTTNBP2 N-terminal-like protein isoform X2 [Pseudoliparis swirei]XP_056279453.1 CTTNBP2 N-terminal-like protein isoform X2 [Pseudoliparis swirei]XP_056279454.1 CTTNBP2 N-terminal-like protein isoform X2 [Pseudoliparis swirei]